jgi:hypothetical protein
VLLAVSLLVTYFAGSMIAMTAAGQLPIIHLQTLAIYDLALSLLIALSMLLLGQAIVAYEVFTGRVLPRRMLTRHWRIAILLAGGYAVVAAWSSAVQLRPVYSLLLAMLLITVGYALYNWRTLREREQFVARLRPFVQSQESTVTSQGASTTASHLLAALCREVLDTAHAQLIPLGSMATLAGPGLTYPAASDTRQYRLPCDLQAGMTPLDPVAFAPYGWVVALWGEWGLSGALLVGEKRDGGLYSQEELEIAQATGERILQLLASEQMLQRLMALQRTRTVEQRVADLQMRRTLHDEILPALHLAVLQLSGKGAQQPVCQDALHTLTNVHRQIAIVLTNGQPAPIRAPDPCNLVKSLRTLIDTEFCHSFAQISWRGDAAQPDAPHSTTYVDALTGEVMVGAAREAIRNAALHARGNSADFPLWLDIELCVEANELSLSIQDNGVGIDTVSIAASTGGSGSGLALHSTLLAMVGGYLTVESPESGGTLVAITVSH